MKKAGNIPIPFENFQHLAQSLSETSLPGEAAHSVIHHYLPTQLDEKRKDFKRASVMCLFFPSSQGETLFALIKRISGIKDDPHSGQISLPGGATEIRESPKSTAIRETWEEIGIKVPPESIIKQMTELYIPVSNFLVSPFIGSIDHTPNFRKQESEVHHIFTPNLSDLLSSQSLKTGTITSEKLTFKDVRYFELDNEVVWGATAMILNEIKSCILEVI